VQVVTRHGARASFGDTLPNQTNAHWYSCALGQELVMKLLASTQFAQVVNATTGRPLEQQPLPPLPSTYEDRATCRPAELLPAGFEMMMELGSNLRRAYAGQAAGGLLSQLDAEGAYVRTTATQRTLGSAVSVLTGLIGPDMQAAMHRPPLRIELHGEEGGEVMMGSACPRADALDDYHDHRAVFASAGVGEANGVLSDVCDGGGLPCTREGGCMEPWQAMQLVGYSEQVLCGRYTGGSPGSQAENLLIQPFLQEIAGRLRAKAEGHRAPRFALYSGHDIVVAPVAGALGFFDCKWTPIGSHVVFELWGTPGAAGAASVRVLFNGGVVTSKVPGCGGGDLCPLAAFEHAVQAPLQGHATHAAACAI